jgi:tRNA A-37 threonylcarbamoyl transferase component Bud32
LSTRAEIMEVALGRVEEISPSIQTVACCAYGPSVCGKPGSWHGFDLMVICDGYPEGIRAHLRLVNKNEVRYLLVDKELVESDVHDGALGDFITDKLLYPYEALGNAEYLDRLAQKLHTRIIREEVRNLVFEYGEMSRGLVAKPEFFALARMRTRARIFPASMNDYLRLLDPAVRGGNLAALRSSFLQAAVTLRGDAVELDEDNNVLIPDGVVDRSLRNKSSGQAVNILKQSQRAFYSYLTRERTIFPSLDLLARELSSPFKAQIERIAIGKEPEDPKNFLFVRTAVGLVSINERSSLEEILGRIRTGRPLIIAPLAGVLNEVFLVTSGKEKFVAKRFTDWHGFKWFTLNLVSFGSKFFSVSGKTRMTNEFGINRYLAKRKLNVPDILHISVNERMLLEQYIPGSPVDQPIAGMVNQTNLSPSQIHLVENLGETLAKIHDVGVSVGDSKPENFVAADNAIYVVDLEQAGKKGDYAWDVAEFLYYSGHYSRNPTPTRGTVDLIEAFIRGYHKRGSKTELKKAAGVKYMKVFSIWTPPPILLEISRMLRET